MLTIHGDGQQSRDFTYIANVVAANLLACQAPDAPGQVINISCGQRYSLLDLVTYLERLLEKRSLQIEFIEARQGDVRHSQADISRARHLLSYETLVDFETGLKKTVEWYQAH